MRTTMDKAGRIIVPKRIRDAVGLVPGEITIEIDGSGVHIEPAGEGVLIERDGRLMLSGGVTMSEEELREFRLADQR